MNGLCSFVFQPPHCLHSAMGSSGVVGRAAGISLSDGCDTLQARFWPAPLANFCLPTSVAPQPHLQNLMLGTSHLPQELRQKRGAYLYSHVIFLSEYRPRYERVDGVSMPGSL